MRTYRIPLHAVDFNALRDLIIDYTDGEHNLHFMVNTDSKEEVLQCELTGDDVDESSREHDETFAMAKFEPDVVANAKTKAQLLEEMRARMKALRDSLEKEIGVDATKALLHEAK